MWQIQVNPKLWDIGQIREDIQKYDVSIPFSRGSGNIVGLKNHPNFEEAPQYLDPVIIVSKGKVIFKGHIISKTGFEEGNLHQQDKYNIGDAREHSQNMKYIVVLLTEEADEDKPSQRQTWTWLTE